MSLQLIVSNIYKSYGGGPVLKDCSFSFDRSGTYILMGPNGCGKSTFLRICSLLEEPDSGEITFFSEGFPLNKERALKRRITLLLPRIGLFDTTVFKNAAYGLEIRGVKRSEIVHRVHKALDFVGLAGKKNQKALTLSSGEMQRLGIARALVIEPEILFLDEPTASVDRKNSEIIEEIIHRIRKEGISIIIMTTHDKAQAERLADRLLLMEDGRISQVFFSRTGIVK